MRPKGPSSQRDSRKSCIRVDTTLRLLNALNSEDRGLKVRFSLATIAFDRESAQMSQMLSSQGKNAPSDPYPHYLVRAQRIEKLFWRAHQGTETLVTGKDVWVWDVVEVGVLLHTHEQKAALFVFFFL